MPEGKEWRVFIVANPGNALSVTSSNVRPFGDKQIVTFHLAVDVKGPAGMPIVVQFGTFKPGDPQTLGIMDRPNLQNEMTLIMA